MKVKSWFFEKIHKIEKPLARTNQTESFPSGSEWIVGDLMTEIRSWRDVRKRLWTKECEQPPETEEVREVFFFAAVRKNTALPISWFFRQKYWSVLNTGEYSQPRDLLDTGNEPASPMSPALQTDSLSPEPVSESCSVVSDSWRPLE